MCYQALPVLLTLKFGHNTALKTCGVLALRYLEAWGLSRWVISRVISTLISGVTLIVTLLITDVLSPPRLQVLIMSSRGV